jgi:hypothetical protein
MERKGRGEELEVMRKIDWKKKTKKKKRYGRGRKRDNFLWFTWAD